MIVCITIAVFSQLGYLSLDENYCRECPAHHGSHGNKTCLQGHTYRTECQWRCEYPDGTHKTYSYQELDYKQKCIVITTTVLSSIFILFMILTIFSCIIISIIYLIEYRNIDRMIVRNCGWGT